MQRKGNTIWILLNAFNNGPMQGYTCEILESGENHRISTENNLNPYKVLELAENIFNAYQDLRSVSITLENCFNEKATGKVYPRFVITRNQDGSYKFRLYLWDGKVKEIMFITPERVMLLLHTEIVRRNNDYNAKHGMLDIGAII